ncbi:MULTISPECIES: GtrA family protein [Pseudomonas]|uniref:GtrA family protein n=1 Tax=Pseudomonas aphyarum TaxID=2942629 RepID=A0ABT5PIM8_9PSED|nr:GtrA family protein [Pseudomonas aphyarum]MDD0970030.1 GtrA family protein [Pseudomonas aphyarum]MDD1123436.1 GtrA family protein [Pseudomonas aphyarum]
MQLVLTYALLAMIATVANIGAQELMIQGYSGKFGVLLSVVVGTGVGLVVKYILDKRYIFRFRARSAVHDTRIFALYSLMGLATTVVFWGFEFGFNHMFETKEMRYMGGVIGLIIGYLVKYQLDKRYVFCQKG